LRSRLDKVDSDCGNAPVATSHCSPSFTQKQRADGRRYVAIPLRGTGIRGTFPPDGVLLTQDALSTRCSRPGKRRHPRVRGSDVFTGPKPFEVHCVLRSNLRALRHRETCEPGRSPPRRWSRLRPLPLPARLTWLPSVLPRDIARRHHHDLRTAKTRSASRDKRSRRQELPQKCFTAMPVCRTVTPSARGLTKTAHVRGFTLDMADGCPTDPAGSRHAAPNGTEYPFRGRDHPLDLSLHISR
jgi:hypothetical protein